MNKYYLYGAGVLLLIGVVVVSQTGPARTVTGTAAVAGVPTTPSTTAKVSTTPTSTTSVSPQDIVPGLYPNPIKNSSVKPGIKITSIIVENNVDATKKPVSDHLEFTIQNLTNTTLSNPEVYYTIVDTANGKTEGYYKSLMGVTLVPRGTATVNFDGQSGVGHYAVNTHGIYGTTTDQLKFSVEVSVAGYALAHVTATKAPGGAEVVGQ